MSFWPKDTVNEESSPKWRTISCNCIFKGLAPTSFVKWEKQLHLGWGESSQRGKPLTEYPAYKKYSSIY